MLPQYKNSPVPVFHKFIVFSVIDESDTVVPKYMQCNNCGIIHKVIDLCQTEVITGKEELRSLATIDELRFSLAEDIVRVLEVYDADLPTWEYVAFAIQNKAWNSRIVLSRDAVNENEDHGKMLIFSETGKMKIETFIQQNTMGGDPHGES